MDAQKESACNEFIRLQSSYVKRIFWREKSHRSHVYQTMNTNDNRLFTYLRKSLLHNICIQISFSHITLPFKLNKWRSFPFYSFSHLFFWLFFALLHVLIFLLHVVISLCIDSLLSLLKAFISMDYYRIKKKNSRHIL